MQVAAVWRSRSAFGGRGRAYDEEVCVLAAWSCEQGLMLLYIKQVGRLTFFFFSASSRSLSILSCSRRAVACLWPSDTSTAVQERQQFVNFEILSLLTGEASEPRTQ
jgi:hypothetical protein